MRNNYDEWQTYLFHIFKMEIRKSNHIEVKIRNPLNKENGCF